jgi:circadian clock protein KaiC
MPEDIKEHRVGPSKVPTGIDGFDRISKGGLPAGRTTLVVGTPGSGKTVFALQTLVNGARVYGEPAIFVAFEESSREIVANAAAFGWDIPRLESSRLFFLDAYLSPQILQSGTFDLAGILAATEERAREMGARRIVFDGIDMLLTMLDDPVAERREIYRIHEWLSRNQYVGILTAKSTFEDPFSTTPWEFMQFMADCVVVLHHRVVDRVALRGARIVKYRGSSFSGNEFPLVIGSEGIEIATFGPDELSFAVSDERVPSGLPRLDEMLGGGYFAGSSVLVTGAPGTAKTTLGCLFAHAACARGGKALHVSLDEPADQIVRNMRSIGVDLGDHVRAGVLKMYSVRTETRSAEEHLVLLDGLIRDFQPGSLVVDPISALGKSGGQLVAGDAAIRLLDIARARGITVLCTSLVPARGAEEGATDIEVSTIADTWIHVAYVLQGGERNRALSVVKSRGMAHSNQVRELVLSSHGATLTDVYVEGGDVLMGTARFVKEMEALSEEQHVHRAANARRLELERQREEVRARLHELERQMLAHDSELRRLMEDQEQRRTRRDANRDEIRRLRGGGARDIRGVETSGA